MLLPFDPRYPLCWSLDFNVNPMASVIFQIVGNDYGNSDARRLHVLEEIILGNSNTPEACRVFRERAQAYLDIARRGASGHVPITVRVYGDPAGNQRRSSADRTDWHIVRDSFARWPELPMEYMVASSAPSVKGRVNAMNAMLCNAYGERRLLVDPKCSELIADLEQVSWKTDSAGNSIAELDKSNLNRSHSSDALGYPVEKEFGLKQYGGPRSGCIA